MIRAARCGVTESRWEMGVRYNGGTRMSICHPRGVLAESIASVCLYQAQVPFSVVPPAAGNEHTNHADPEVAVGVNVRSLAGP